MLLRKQFLRSLLLLRGHYNPLGRGGGGRNDTANLLFYDNRLRRGKRPTDADATAADANTNTDADANTFADANASGNGNIRLLRGRQREPLSGG